MIARTHLHVRLTYTHTYSTLLGHLDPAVLVRELALAHLVAELGEVGLGGAVHWCRRAVGVLVHQRARGLQAARRSERRGGRAAQRRGGRVGRRPVSRPTRHGDGSPSLSRSRAAPSSEACWERPGAHGCPPSCPSSRARTRRTRGASFACTWYMQRWPHRGRVCRPRRTCGWRSRGRRRSVPSRRMSTARTRRSPSRRRERRETGAALQAQRPARRRWRAVLAGASRAAQAPFAQSTVAARIPDRASCRRRSRPSFTL